MFFMKSIDCPHCGAQVAPTSAGECPACRRRVRESSPALTLSAAPAQLAAVGPNPYNSPTTTELQPPPGESPEEGPDAINAKRNAQPFWRQAAVFSFYAPFVVVLMEVAISTLRSGRPLHPFALIGLGILAAAIVVAGLVLGVVGLVGAARRNRLGISLLALFGLLLNGGFIAFCVRAALIAKQLR